MRSVLFKSVEPRCEVFQDVKKKCYHSKFTDPVNKNIKSAQFIEILFIIQTASTILQFIKVHGRYYLGIYCDFSKKIDC